MWPAAGYKGNTGSDKDALFQVVIMKSVLRTSGDTVATVHAILSYSAGFLCMCASRDAQIRRR